jgi:hypothetical protein
MSKANCRLAWNSVADGKAISATSYDGNMIPENLLKTQIQSKWRSANTSVQTLSGDIGELLPIGYFLLYAHNLSVGSTIQFVVSINADYSSPVIDTTFESVEPAYGLGELLGLYLGGYATDNFFTKYIRSVSSPRLAPPASWVTDVPSVPCLFANQKASSIDWGLNLLTISP